MIFQPSLDLLTTNIGKQICIINGVDLSFVISLFLMWENPSVNKAEANVAVSLTIIKTFSLPLPS